MAEKLNKNKHLSLMKPTDPPAPFCINTGEGSEPILKITSAAKTAHTAQHQE